MKNIYWKNPNKWHIHNMWPGAELLLVGHVVLQN